MILVCFERVLISEKHRFSFSSDTPAVHFQSGAAACTGGSSNSAGRISWTGTVLPTFFLGPTGSWRSFSQNICASKHSEKMSGLVASLPELDEDILEQTSINSGL